MQKQTTEWICTNREERVVVVEQPAVPREEDADDDDGGAIKELLFILPNGFYCASECEDLMEDDGPKEEDLFLRTY